MDITAVTACGLDVLLSGQTETASISKVAFFGCSTQSVSATYGGDGNYGASTSAALTFTPVKETTALALSANPANGAVGQQVTLVATLAPFNYGTTTTNGETVTFTNNGKVIGTAPLASGVATLVYTPPGGKDSYQATYAGDCSFSGRLQQYRDRYDPVGLRSCLGDARTNFLWNCTERHTVERDG